jgi:serine O-acetyltransferase
VHLPDPIADAIKVLANRITELERQLDEARGAPAEVRPLRPATDDSVPDPLASPRAVGPNPAGG